MSAWQRNKGANGEREVIQILSEALGIKLTRNWLAQSADGGCDILGIPGWAIEVKRAKQENKLAWWRQTVAQAAVLQLKPALVFRIDNFGRGLDAADKWQVMVPIYTIRACPDKIEPTQMCLRLWIYFLAQEDWHWPTSTKLDSSSTTTQLPQTGEQREQS